MDYDAVPAVESFKALKERLQTEQAGMTKDEFMLSHPHLSPTDLDNLPKTTHNWVKRGIVMSCEGGNHPSHRHFLVKR